MNWQIWVFGPIAVAELAALMWAGRHWEPEIAAWLDRLAERLRAGERGETLYAASREGGSVVRESEFRQPGESKPDWMARLVAEEGWVWSSCPTHGAVAISRGGASTSCVKADCDEWMYVRELGTRIDPTSVARFQVVDGETVRVWGPFDLGGARRFRDHMNETGDPSHRIRELVWQDVADPGHLASFDHLDGPASVRKERRPKYLVRSAEYFTTNSAGAGNRPRSPKFESYCRNLWQALQGKQA